MRVVETKHLSSAQRIDLLAIWNEVYPGFMTYNDSSDFDAYLATLEKGYHYLVQNDLKVLVGWMCTFIRDDQRWFLMIVRSDYQGQGVGSKLLRRARVEEGELYGWVAKHNRYKRSDGSSYRSPIGFYQKHGFLLEEDIRFDNGKLKAFRIVWRKKAPLD